MFHSSHISISEALPNLVEELMNRGIMRQSRNGDVIEILNAQIQLTSPFRREVINPGRGANVFAQIAETMWVLAGRNDIEWLSAYLPRAVDYSDNGKVWHGGYGPRLRHHFGFDQIEHVVDVLKADPLSRRAVIAIYDPRTDVPAGKDVPCNDFLQFQIRGDELHLTVTVRSNDLMWGWSGINAFEWSTLQEIVARLVDTDIGTLTFNIGNLHLYWNHWKRAQKIEQVPWNTLTSLKRIAFDPDQLVTDISQVDTLIDGWFNWENLCRKGEATWDLLDDGHQDPLFKAWAAAIAYYWQRDEFWLDCLEGTLLRQAIALVPASVMPEPVRKPSEAPASAGPVAGHPTLFQDPQDAFYSFVTKLHATKHASYGDSWKKRGEQMSILANIARKIDRLGVGDEYDSSADTVIDLWVYLAKYLTWLQGSKDSGPSDVDPLLHRLLNQISPTPQKNWQEEIPARFNRYVDQIDTLSQLRKREEIWFLLQDVTPIARSLWCSENEYRPDLGV